MDARCIKPPRQSRKEEKNETKKNKKRRNMNIKHGASIEPLSQRDVVKEIYITLFHQKLVDNNNERKKTLK